MLLPATPRSTRNHGRRRLSHVRHRYRPRHPPLHTNINPVEVRGQRTRSGRGLPLVRLSSDMSCSGPPWTCTRLAVATDPSVPAYVPYVALVLGLVVVAATLMLIRNLGGARDWFINHELWFGGWTGVWANDPDRLRKKIDHEKAVQDRVAVMSWIWLAIGMLAVGVGVRFIFFT